MSDEQISKVEIGQSENIPKYLEDGMSEDGTCGDCCLLAWKWVAVWCECTTYTIFCVLDQSGSPECEPIMWSGGYDMPEDCTLTGYDC